MKRLSIFRHAEAAPADPVTNDHDRPLTVKGAEDASIVATVLARRGFGADCILCSTAVRTRQTLAPVLEKLNPDARLFYSERLYNAPPARVLAEIHDAPPECAHILYVGHNPGLHHLALELIDPSRAAARPMERIARKFAPGALAHLDFDVDDWGEVRAARGALTGYETPADLNANGAAK